MKEFPAYQAPFLSFFSGDLYRQVAGKWSGIGFGYLTLVTLVCVIVSSVGLCMSMNSAVESLFSKMPGITLKNYKLSIDKPVPYVIQLDIPGDANKIVFDTSGKMKSLEDAEGAIMLVTEDELIMKDRVSEESRSSWKTMDAQDWTLTRESLTQLKALVGQIVLGIMVVLGIMSLFGHYFLALLYGAIGLIMSNVTGAKLGFGATVRLACVAMTPAMLVSMLSILFGQMIVAQWWGGLSIPVTLGFLYFACAAAAKNAPES